MSSLCVPRLVGAGILAAALVGCASLRDAPREESPAVASASSRADSPAGRSAAAAREKTARARPAGFDAGTVPFTLRFDGIETSLGTISAFILPGRTLHVDVPHGRGTFTASASAGRLAATGSRSWAWTAPLRHGDHEILIRNVRARRPHAPHERGQAEQAQPAAAVVDEARLRVFVLHPYDGSTRLGHYWIGRYQNGAKDDDPAYLRPGGLVEVTPENRDALVSPHFRLGQFLCKDDATFPKYVVLRTALLVKLEMVMQAMDAAGLKNPVLHVMSGYRTPSYNAAIGNQTSWSRHVYGDAADVFLDRDGDEMHDDLDGDGRSTVADARILYELIDGHIDESVPDHLAGGLSVYGPTPYHGPFVHIDTRGKRARW